MLRIDGRFLAAALAVALALGFVAGLLLAGLV